MFESRCLHSAVDFQNGGILAVQEIGEQIYILPWNGFLRLDQLCVDSTMEIAILQALKVYVSRELCGIVHAVRSLFAQVECMGHRCLSST